MGGASHSDRGALLLLLAGRRADVVRIGDSMGPRTVGTVDLSTDWTPERSRPGWSSFRGSARPEEITPPNVLQPIRAGMGDVRGEMFPELR